MNIDAQTNQAWETYQNTLDEIGERWRKSTLLPFLKRNNATFVNGFHWGWRIYLYDDRKREIRVDTYNFLRVFLTDKHILDMLDREIKGMPTFSFAALLKNCGGEHETKTD